MLASLGWLALCALDRGAVAGGLVSEEFKHEPAETQRRLWGIDHASLTRRLARQWGLPGWLGSVIGHLNLPAEVAATFGADPALFHLTRLALSLAQKQGFHLGLVNAEMTGESAAALTLTEAELDETDVGAEVEAARGTAVKACWQVPATQPLLRDLLLVAAENRRLRSLPHRQRLEAELDTLHQVLERQVRTESERLQTAKLGALAEFAAGAGHEINNPLAVISGQAQYLLAHEPNWFPGDTDGNVRKSLQVIVAQTRRMHSLLRDLMQFARPPAPDRVWIDLPTLLGEAASSLHDFATQRRVRVEVAFPVDRLAVEVDPDQVRLALSCLLSNAIEAAPAEGLVRMTLVPPGTGKWTDVVVEDSGPGPTPEQKPHLFDPFYSGRTAGRGRGMGLPIAWRLARQNGGNVWLEPSRPQQPTRFILRLAYTPLEEPLIPAIDARLSAAIPALHSEAPSNGHCAS
jgi:signal transduction histidine kinase